MDRCNIRTNATNIQDIRVIKARATAAGKDPGLPDPTRIIYLRHNVVLIFCPVRQRHVVI
jgi:hypothetical protein